MLLIDLYGGLYHESKIYTAQGHIDGNYKYVHYSFQVDFNLFSVFDSAYQHIHLCCYSPFFENCLIEFKMLTNQTLP